MITNFNKYKLITEDPDYVRDRDNGANYQVGDRDARPFCSIVNGNTVEKMYFGDKGTYHGSMNNERGSYPGRIWLDNKIIAFWVYPNEDLFRSMIHYIENKFGIKIFNNGWRMEVIKNNGELKRKLDYQDSYMNTGGYENAVIIPLDEYAGSEDVPEEQKIQHLMNWQEKELAKQAGKIHFGGKFGSNLTAWDQEHNIKWRQAMYQEKKKN